MSNSLDNEKNRLLKFKELTYVRRNRDKRKLMRHIVSPGLGSLNIDLMIMERERSKNKGYAYGLVMIDIYSRYGWVIPLKRKTASETATKFRDWYMRTAANAGDGVKDKYPLYDIKSDNGGEFMGVFKQYVKSLGIPHRYIEVGAHNDNAHVERFIQTIRKRLLEVWIANENYDWVSYIDTVIKDYNNTIHSSIGVKPVDVYRGKVQPKVKNQPEIDELNVGDNVRVLLDRARFTKPSSNILWSKNVYKVSQKLDNNRYKLEGKGDKRYPRWVLRRSKFKPEDNKKIDILDVSKKEIEGERRIERRIRKEGIERHPQPEASRPKRNRKRVDPGFFIVH